LPDGAFRAHRFADSDSSSSDDDTSQVVQTKPSSVTQLFTTYALPIGLKPLTLSVGKHENVTVGAKSSPRPLLASRSVPAIRETARPHTSIRLWGRPVPSASDSTFSILSQRSASNNPFPGDQIMFSQRSPKSTRLMPFPRQPSGYPHPLAVPSLSGTGAVAPASAVVAHTVPQPGPLGHAAAGFVTDAHLDTRQYVRSATLFHIPRNFLHGTGGFPHELSGSDINEHLRSQAPQVATLL